MTGSEPSVTSNMDDAERMELALNADFASELLDCFDAPKDDDVIDVDDHRDAKLAELAVPPLPHHTLPGSPSWDNQATPLTTTIGTPLASLFMDQPDGYRQSIDDLFGVVLPSRSFRGNPADAAAVSAAEKTPSPIHFNSPAFIMVSADGSTVDTSAIHQLSGGTADPKQLQPLRQPAGTSSATMQESLRESLTSTKLHPEGILSSANCPPHVVVPTRLVAQGGEVNPSLFPLAYNAFAAGLNFSATHPLLYQSISSMATAAPPPVPVPAHVSAPHNQHPPSSKSKRRRASRTHTATNRSESPPPFHLFDAPMELRANFIKAQRSLGLPVLQDNNSYHYQRAIAESNSRRNTGDNPLNSVPTPRLVDGRHITRSGRGGGVGGGVSISGENRNKNAKEQKRAQKIAELIDQLRVKMEDGGWKLGIKSKFHTLSSCTDYLRHLMQVNKEKETSLENAKNDLAAKKHLLQEDKAQQQSSSDPESTTSSLTVSSGSGEVKKGVQDGKTSLLEEDTDMNQREWLTTAGTAKSAARLCSHESSVSLIKSSFKVGDSSTTRAVHRAAPATTISVSEISDSNKGSTTNSSSPKRSSESSYPYTNHKQTETSFSSEPSLVGGRHGQSKEGSRNDVMLDSGKRKLDTGNTRSVSEQPPDSLFDLDYQDVFTNSNVPQLLATSSGKIIAWNLFFQKATGFTEQELCSLSIFSLVPPNKLSRLFEIVAAALKTQSGNWDATGGGKKTEKDDIDGNNDIGDEEDEETSDEEEVNYSALTIPCVVFPGQVLRAASELPHPLYMTVTLMSDQDPRRRCFLCVFTDAPGTGEALGSISVELLSRLVSIPAPNKAPSSGHVRHRTEKRHCSNPSILPTL